jgi:fructokinase
MIYTLGESLLDIIFSNNDKIFAYPGGGMLNTSVSLGRSGVEVSLISELGDDETAKTILDFLHVNKVRTKYIKKYFHQNTSVALAHLDKQKIPSFSIYKSYPKNRRLISPKIFRKGDILIYGSLYSLDPSIRNEIVDIISQAKRGGAILCYDPNIRKHNLDAPLLRNALHENFAFADIIKGSDEDFATIFGCKTDLEYLNEIRNLNPDAAFIITKGKNGVNAYSGKQQIVMAAEKVEVISTIGAGDAFTAGLVYYIEKLKGHKEKKNLAGTAIFQEIISSGLRFSAEVCASKENYIPTPQSR